MYTKDFFTSKPWRFLLLLFGTQGNNCYSHSILTNSCCNSTCDHNCKKYNLCFLPSKSDRSVHLTFERDAWEGCLSPALERVPIKRSGVPSFLHPKTTKIAAFGKKNKHKWSQWETEAWKTQAPLANTPRHPTLNKIIALTKFDLWRKGLDAEKTAPTYF